MFNRRRLLQSIGIASVLGLAKPSKAEAKPPCVKLFKQAETKASPEARAIAAQLWCDPEVSDREMDVDLAEIIARKIDEYREALEKFAEPMGVLRIGQPPKLSSWMIHQQLIGSSVAVSVQFSYTSDLIFPEERPE